MQQAAALQEAAQSGSAVAQAKLGAWLGVRHGRFAEAARWFESAAASGHEAAQA